MQDWYVWHVWITFTDGTQELRITNREPETTAAVLRVDNGPLGVEQFPLVGIRKFKCEHPVRGYGAPA